METEASFAPLDRVVAKYRHDVHHLSPSAPREALVALEDHVGQRLPRGLRQFLSLHNGASLFRGALRVRSTADMAVASTASPSLVLFADGPGERRWAWAIDRSGQPVFGEWTGGRMRASHRSFAGWLAGSISEIESRVVRDEDRDAVRLAADPEDVWQLCLAGERALQAGAPEKAEESLMRATEVDRDHAWSWQLLGDALVIRDRGAAREAWLRAFRKTHLPIGWTGAPVLDSDVLRSLASSFSEPDAWERELQRFLDDRVADTTTVEEAMLVQRVVLLLARSLVGRGKRREARATVSETVARFHTFAWSGAPWDVVLELAHLESTLGHHDEAEALLRRLCRDGPDTYRGRALLELSTIATARQEPWAEELLVEARVAGLDDEGRVRWNLRSAERAIRMEQSELAERSVTAAELGVKRIGLQALQVELALVRGDLCRLQEDWAHARSSWKSVLEFGKGEVKHRAELRLGDLALSEGDVESAERWYRCALEGFASSVLPVREAWTLVRLGRIALAAGQRPPRQLVSAAYDRFAEADLASGMASVDVLAGDAGKSLGWHLERSAAHARARHDAQRSRPPWTRADADRPERRLGAHRLAIAASGPSIVRALEKELDACARASTVGRGRPTDPPVLRYIGAVDLLSGHRSYEAAEVLLRHLLEKRVEGAAYRALQGAIARSPNAALVDGLLRCIEQPRSTPSHAVSAAAELLGLRREKTAVAALLHLILPTASPIVRRGAIVALGRIGDRSAAEGIAAGLSEPSLAEPAALALLMLGDLAGLRFHRDALVQRRTDLSGHPGEIIGRYGGPENLLLLQTVAAGSDEMALGAIQGIGLFGDPRGVPNLLQRLRTPDTRVVEVAAGALEMLTGHHEDLERPGARHRWDAWWKLNAEALQSGARHRGGELFDPGWLIRRMAHDDPYTRRTAYDELVIMTGHALPFDADGPWRVQNAHLRAWRSWWEDASIGLAAGRWYLDGQALH